MNIRHKIIYRRCAEETRAEIMNIELGDHVELDSGVVLEVISIDNLKGEQYFCVRSWRGDFWVPYSKIKSIKQKHL